MKNNKKGNATVYLVIITLLAIAVAVMFIKLNWRRFKAEASFGFTVAGIVIAVLLILFLMIRHSIRKAKKEQAKEQARLEDGKFELNDISEAAGKAMDKVDKFLEGGE